jgi:uncharacterized protein with HEPN domain
VFMRHPEIPWEQEQVRSAGNVYRHEYDNIAEGQVWRTVHNSLPSLLSAIAKEFDKFGMPLSQA